MEKQSTKYVAGVPGGMPAWRTPLPFSYESTGSETRFTSRLNPDPCSRRVFSFHRPETLLAWLQQVAGGGSPLEQRLREFPPLAVGALWPAQIEVITNLEKSFAAGRPRALILNGHRLRQNLYRSQTYPAGFCSLAKVLEPFPLLLRRQIYTMVL